MRTLFPLILIAVATALAAALVWVLFPTGLESKLSTFRTLTVEEYKVIRDDASAFSKTVESKGIRVHLGPDRGASFEFTCKGVPLLLIDNGPILLTAHSFGNVDQRAPGLRAFREHLYAQLTPEGRPAVSELIHGEPTGLEAFILKHRDGIDIAEQCR
ncbi:hypothetical protein [Stenotrophomonas sp.]|uniref:hypothetical protein n=1 Tax=Stenotrophomonas sp. TaxID=69392 RepID=UPI003D6CCF9E